MCKEERTRLIGSGEKKSSLFFLEGSKTLSSIIITAASSDIMTTIVIISLSLALLMISFIYVYEYYYVIKREMLVCLHRALLVYMYLSWFCSLFNSCFSSQYQGHFFVKSPWSAWECFWFSFMLSERESVERENRIININGSEWSWFNTWALCWFCGFEFITANKRIKGHLGEISCFYCKYIMITILCTLAACLSLFIDFD